MAGFRRWAIFTLEQPITELARHNQHGSMPFSFEHRPSPFAFEPTLPKPTEQSSLLPHARDGAATGAFLRATWPYYYRFLASYDPGLAQIMAGQPLVPRAPTGGPTAFQSAATQAEMTFRHTRPGGNVLQVGTDRISTGNNLVRILEASQGRGTGQIIRIDPSVVSRTGQTFLSARDVLADLDEFEQITRRELDEAARAGRGRNHLDRLRNRLNGINQARQYVRSYGEGHGVGSIPSRAVSGVRSTTAELRALRATQGLRVAGGVLMVYGAYESVDRIASASASERPRVATQEVGGWAGGFAGAWAVGQLFAVGGAALGIETGPGAVVTGLIGGIVGGIVGGIGGAMGADWVYARINDP